MPKGYIYIMTNPALRHMVKIGYAKDVDERCKKLSTTALPYAYEVYATYETDRKLSDKQLHNLIDSLNPDLRVTKNREFFLLEPDDAYKLLEAIATISGTKDKLKLAVNVDSQKQVVHKPPVNFRACGIPVGAKLVYKDDSSIVVTVVDERKVEYNDEITSLSAVTERLQGKSSVQGTAWFTYNDEFITDIAERTQWKNF